MAVKAEMERRAERNEKALRTQNPLRPLLPKRGAGSGEELRGIRLNRD
jgi:hypothetical protein